MDPRRAELRDRHLAARIPVVPIDQLREEADPQNGGHQDRPEAGDGRVVAVVEYREGSTVIDVVRRVATAGPSKSSLQAGRSELGPVAGRCCRSNLDRMQVQRKEYR